MTERISEKRQTFLMALMLLLFLWEILKISGFVFFYWADASVSTLKLLAAGAIAFSVPWNSNRHLWVLTTGLLAIAASSLIRDFTVYLQTQDTITAGLFVFLACCPFAACLSEKNQRRFLLMLAALWSVSYFLLTSAGVFVSIYGQRMVNPVGQYLGIDPADHRFGLFAFYTSSANYLMMCILMALMGFVLCGKKKIRWLFPIMAIPMVICLALTDGRTAFISLGFGLGMAASVLAAGRLQGKQRRRCLAAVLCVMLCVVLVYAVLPGVVNCVGQIQQMIAAGAEETAGEVANTVHRTDTEMGFLTGRQYAWNACLQLLTDHPSLLLTGTSEPFLYEMLNAYTLQYTALDFPHAHNILLQILMETGVIGLGLALVFLVMFARAAFDLMYRGSIALWKRLLPVLPLAVLLTEMAECMTKLNRGLLTAPITFMMMGMVFAVHARENAAGQFQKAKERS